MEESHVKQRLKISAPPRPQVIPLGELWKELPVPTRESLINKLVRLVAQFIDRDEWQQRRILMQRAGTQFKTGQNRASFKRAFGRD